MLWCTLSQTIKHNGNLARKEIIRTFFLGTWVYDWFTAPVATINTPRSCKSATNPSSISFYKMQSTQTIRWWGESPVSLVRWHDWFSGHDDNSSHIQSCRPMEAHKIRTSALNQPKTFCRFFGSSFQFCIDNHITAKHCTLYCKIYCRHSCWDNQFKRGTPSLFGKIMKIGWFKLNHDQPTICCHCTKKPLSTR